MDVRFRYMKKIWIIGICLGVFIGLILVLMRASCVNAHSALQSEDMRSQVESFFPEDHFIVIDPNTKAIVPGPIATDDAFLSIEPNTKDVCWTFTVSSWHDAVTIYISLLGNPVSIGRVRWIDEPNKSLKATSQ